MSDIILITILSILFGLFVIFGIGLFIILSERTKNKQVVERNPEIIKIILNKDSFEDVNNLIDSFIKDAIQLYRILNVVVEETYLNKDTLKEMEAYVYQTVMKKMSPDIINVISMFYVIESHKDIEDIIKLRIKLHLIQNAVSQNKPIEE